MELRFESSDYDLSVLMNEVSAAVPNLQIPLTFTGEGNIVVIFAPCDLPEEDVTTIASVVEAHGTLENITKRKRAELKRICTPMMHEWDWVYLKYKEQTEILGITPTVSLEQVQQVAQYKQALRDLPETCADPFNPVWPTPPTISQEGV